MTDQLPDIAFKPVSSSRIVESEEVLGQSVFLYDDSNGLVHTMNGGAGMIWLLCDGTRDIQQIAAELAHASDVPESELISQVQEAVGRFQELGLLAS